MKRKYIIPKNHKNGGSMNCRIRRKHSDLNLDLYVPKSYTMRNTAIKYCLCCLGLIGIIVWLIL